ncbi:MAG: LamG-like jellyroll fold domain-containing protein [Verrucomicrobiota bacterium]
MNTRTLRVSFLKPTPAVLSLLRLLPLLGLFGVSLRAAEPQILQRGIPAAAQKLQPVAVVPSSEKLQFSIGLPIRNKEALTNLVRQLYDPRSPKYRQFLTPGEFARRFGPSQGDYRKLIAFANAHHLAVMATHPNRTLLDVQGSVADIEKALHVRMFSYRHPHENRLYYAPNSNPSIELSIPVLGIEGLNNYSPPQPRIRATDLSTTSSFAGNAGSGPGGTYMGNDFRAAYVPDSSLTGVGQTVGLVQFDGYNASDINYYLSHAGLPSITLSNVLLDGFSGAPTGGGGEIEVCLDIEMVASMAPSVSRIIVYMAGPYGNWHDMLNRIATDNLAKQVSCSWYTPNGPADPVADQIFLQMAAQGQSFFNASGDEDAYTGLIDFPGDTPYITQVGGTTLTTGGPGGAWVSEKVWNWGGGLGSGGGISTSYPIPAWQTNVNMSACQGSAVKRNTPDVAMVADGVYVRAQGRDYNVGGTSCAAPLWAGFAALANQLASISGRPAIGFVNPAVYGLGLDPRYNSAFHDTTTGNNTSPASPTKFYAVAGYDLCTGWGTPVGQALINALANPDPLLILPSEGFSSFGAQGGPMDQTVKSFVLTNTGKTSLSWSLINTSGWLSASSTGGTLTAGGPSTALTIGLNTVASNLAAGSYSAEVYFTNLASASLQSRHFSLQLVPSNLPPVIVTQPVSQTIFIGQQANFSVNATGTPFLQYQWALNGTNLAGATNTSLHLTKVQYAQAGNYSVTVTNVNGSLVSSNATLTVNPPPPCATAPAGLVSWWRGEDDATDAAGSNIGIVHGGLVYDSGEVGDAFQMNGQDSYVKVPASSTLDVGTGEGLTVEGWINPSVIDVERPIVEWNNAAGGLGVHFWVSTQPTFGNGPGCLYANVVDTAGAFHTFASASGLIVAGTYQHVGLTYDKTAGIARMYLNGAMVAEQTLGVFTPQTSYDLYLGYRASGAARANVWLGALDEISLYNRALTGAEFQSIYTAGMGGKCLGTVAPVILSGPLSQSVVAGASAAFTVSTSGSQPMHYQWYFNGATALGGATNSSLVLINVQPGQAGSYSVAVTNTAGYALSSNAVLTVQSLSSCATVPAGLTGWWKAEGSAQDAAGTNNGVSLGNVAYGAGEVGQAFSLNGVDAGVKVPASASVNVGAQGGLTVEGWINPTVIDVERSIVEWNDGVSHLGVHLWVSTQPGFGNGAGCLYANVVDTNGGFHTFASAGGLVVAGTNQHVALTYDRASGIGTLMLNGVVVAQSALGSFTPETRYDLYLGHRAWGGANAYWWAGMLDEMSIYGRALGTNEIQAIFLAGADGKCAGLPPSILVQPTNQTAIAGSNASFAVSASGSPPLSYRWLKNGFEVLDGGAISGATTPQLILSGVQDQDAGTYSVLVTNGIGVVLSSPATLTVIDPPLINAQPVSRTNVVGTTATFTVSASGTLPLAFQWSKDGATLTDQGGVSGSTNATLQLNNIQYTDAGNYSVAVSNLGGLRISSNAVLTVVSAGLCDPVPSGLVSWWKAEDNLQDATGTNNGLAIGGLAFSAGEVGQAFALNGSDAAVQVPASPSLDVGQGAGFTIEGWINPSVIDVERPIAEWNNGNGGLGAHLWVSTPPSLGSGQGCLYANLVDSSGNFHALASAAGLVVSGQFQHVALTYDRAAGIARLYLNGIVVAQETFGSFTPQTSYDFHLGHRPWGGAQSQWWSGVIDEISLYNRAMDDSEVQAIYAAGAAGKCSGGGTSCVPPAAGLTGWWKAEGSAQDAAGTNNGVSLGNVAYGTGEVGQAFSLNGVDAGVKVPASASVNVGAQGGLTVEGWINPTVIDVERPIVEWNDGVSHLGVHLWVSTQPGFGNGAGCLYANVVDTNGGFHTFASAGGLVVAGTNRHGADADGSCERDRNADVERGGGGAKCAGEFYAGDAI